MDGMYELVLRSMAWDGYRPICMSEKGRSSDRRGCDLGPSIILDKCAWQALSRAEIIQLHARYYVVYPPILFREVLGDLMKRFTKGKLAEDQVRGVAGKFFSMDSCINVNWATICKHSLQGDHCPMDGRAVNRDAKRVTSRGGGYGTMVDYTAACRDFLRWREGGFSEAESLKAQAWREKSRTADLQVLAGNMKCLFPQVPKAVCLVDLTQHVDEFLACADREWQQTWLRAFMGILRLSPNVVDEVCERWRTAEMPPFSEFAPYAFFCFRALTIFCLGLDAELVTPRSTNLVDLEYLLYLPFCKVFSTDDKFLKAMCPHLLREDQELIEGRDLKHQLSEAVAQAQPKRSQPADNQHGQSPGDQDA